MTSFAQLADFFCIPSQLTKNSRNLDSEAMVYQETSFLLVDASICVQSDGFPSHEALRSLVLLILHQPGCKKAIASV